MGGTFGFTQDPDKIGDVVGQRVQRRLGLRPRFGISRRFDTMGEDEGAIPWAQEMAEPMGKFAPEATDTANAAVTPTGAVEAAPQFPAHQRFKEALGQMPEREDPGWGRILAGALMAGMSEYGRPGTGREVGERVIEAPNQRRMDKYNKQVEAARRAAQMEREEFDMGQTAARSEREKRGEERDIKVTEARLKEAASDKKIDEYVNKANQRVLVFQKVDGSSYEKTMGEVQPKADVTRTLDEALMSDDPAVRQRAIEALREKHRFDRQPSEGKGRQMQVVAERNKARALREAERAYRKEIAQGTSTPEEAQEALTDAKQAAEDAYVAELEGAGLGPIEPFDYRAQAERARGGKPAVPGEGGKPAPTKHKVGDRIKRGGRTGVISKIYPDGTADVTWE